MCDHKLIKTMQGWFCSECKQFFDNKPTAPKEGKITFLNVTEEKPKKNSRSTSKK